MSEKEPDALKVVHQVCPGKIEVPTKKEQEALAALKRIKEQVRVLKKDLESLAVTGRDGEDDKILKKEEALAGLKIEWKAWEEKRKAAAKERMIILGHEDSP